MRSTPSLSSASRSGSLRLPSRSRRSRRTARATRSSTASTYCRTGSTISPAGPILPEQAMERLGKQIALIADKIDRGPAMPDADYIFQGLEQRFDVLSGMMERRQGDALEQGNMLFRDLERRLDEVADRLDQRVPQVDGAVIMDAIDARFTALAQRMETRVPDPANEAAIRGLESRLEDISSRLESSAAQRRRHRPGADPQPRGAGRRPVGSSVQARHAAAGIRGHQPPPRRKSRSLWQEPAIPSWVLRARRPRVPCVRWPAPAPTRRLFPASPRI